MRDKICVALDVQYDEALMMLNKLQGLLGWIKIGPVLLTTENGVKLMRSAKSMGFKVFADFKFKDIPSVVSKGIKNLHGVADLVTVHIDGGEQMLREAKAAAENILVIGVTLLTSLNWKDLRDFNIPKGIDEQAQVASMAKIGSIAEIDGVVSSARELALLKKAYPDFFFVTPGLKMGVNECDYRKEQKRDADPRWAYQQGSNLLVMGRDIYQAADPVKRIDDIEKWCLES